MVGLPTLREDPFPTMNGGPPGVIPSGQVPDDEAGFDPQDRLQEGSFHGNDNSCAPVSRISTSGTTSPHLPLAYCCGQVDADTLS
jgi:hypothetical protein